MWMFSSSGRCPWPFYLITETWCLTDLVSLALFLFLMFTSVWPWLPLVFIAAHFTDMQNGERLMDDSQGR